MDIPLRLHRTPTPTQSPPEPITNRLRPITIGSGPTQTPPAGLFSDVAGRILRFTRVNPPMAGPARGAFPFSTMEQRGDRPVITVAPKFLRGCALAPDLGFTADCLSSPW